MQIRQGLYRLLSHRFPSVAWTLLIFILLALPGSVLPNEKHFSIPQLDKMVHVVLFGSFVFLWSFYFSTKKTNENLRKKYLRITIIACIYGYVMELIQKYFIPNRDYDIYDVAADVLGAIIGYVVLRIFVDRRVKSKE
jgi:VanZ family protein